MTPFFLMDTDRAKRLLFRLSVYADNMEAEARYLKKEIEEIKKEMKK